MTNGTYLLRFDGIMTNLARLLHLQFCKKTETKQKGLQFQETQLDDGLFTDHILSWSIMFSYQREQGGSTLIKCHSFFDRRKLKLLSNSKTSSNATN